MTVNSAPSRVTLSPFDEDGHLSLLVSWLDRPHVSQWWGARDEVLAEMAKTPATRMLILEDRQPVGFVCWQQPTEEEWAEAGLEDRPDGLMDIDIMIGEPDAMGRGIGPRALELVLERLRTEGWSWAGLATEVENVRALRAYEKIGFQQWRGFVEEGKRMVYLTRALA